MEPTSLNRLLEESDVTCTPSGLTVTIHPHWIIEGEDRLSYTTLTRLIECCREHHWNTDIIPIAEDSPIDSITKSITGEFTKAIPVGSVVSITCRVAEVRRRGYRLEFEVCNATDQTLHAEFDMVSVFYDPVAQKAVAPPASVTEHLLARLSTAQASKD